LLETLASISHALWLRGCGCHPTSYQGVDDIERPEDDESKEEDGAERGKGGFRNNLMSGLLIISGIVVTVLGVIVVMVVFIFSMHGLMRTLDRICDHTREEIGEHTGRKQAQMYNNAPIGTCYLIRCFHVHFEFHEKLYDLCI
jgi:hypothetical protein